MGSGRRGIGRKPSGKAAASPNAGEHDKGRMEGSGEAASAPARARPYNPCMHPARRPA
ncbi:hypothetical protein GCM10023332_07920 [Luteimonas vadosa]|uniref:Uncharacterized protein n=1 Tax=Luteimonas vadosa TaxID=1165507 RepID=A0ABP9DXY6_9GAMM